MNKKIVIAWKNNHLPMNDHQKKEMVLQLKKLLRDIQHAICSIRIDGSDCPCLCGKSNLVLLTIQYSANLKIPAETFSTDTIQCSHCPVCGEYKYLIPLLTAIQLLSHTL